MRLLLIIALVLALIALYFIFKPESMTYVDNPPVNLEGIMWKEDEGMAVISGQVLRKSDTIEGYRIIKIGKGDFVTLSFNNQCYKLTFNGLFKVDNIVRYTIKNWFKDKISRWFKQEGE